MLGIVLDGIPESFVVGIGLLSGEGISAAFVAAVFLSNLPESAAASAGLAGRLAAEANLRPLGRRDRGRGSGGGGRLRRPRRRIGRLGRVRAGFRGRRDPDMLADTMMPEAFEKGGKAAGLLTTLGFAAAVLISALDARLRGRRAETPREVPYLERDHALPDTGHDRPHAGQRHDDCDRQPGSAQRPDADRARSVPVRARATSGDVAIREGADNVEDSARDHEDPDEDAGVYKPLSGQTSSASPAPRQESGDDVRRAVAAVQGLGDDERGSLDHEEHAHERRQALHAPVDAEDDRAEDDRDHAYEQVEAPNRGDAFGLFRPNSVPG